MSQLKVVYIAGPYRVATERGVAENIRRAGDLALEVWRAGMVALCPHMNTALFGGACPDEVWLLGDLELMRRCDAILLVPGWRQSNGTIAEVSLARREGMPIFESITDLSEWARTTEARS